MLRSWRNFFIFSFCWISLVSVMSGIGVNTMLWAYSASTMMCGGRMGWRVRWWCRWLKSCSFSSVLAPSFSYLRIINYVFLRYWKLHKMESIRFMVFLNKLYLQQGPQGPAWDYPSDYLHLHNSCELPEIQEQCHHNAAPYNNNNWYQEFVFNLKNSKKIKQYAICKIQI